MYGIDLHINKYRYFTIGGTKPQVLAFLPCKRKITVNDVSPVKLELEKFKSEQANEAEVNIHITYVQKNELSALLSDHKESFEKDKGPLGEVVGHEVNIILNIKRLYPPLLRRHAYPESPKSREALELHIKKSLDIGVIRNICHNKEVEISTPVIVALNIGKYRMVGDFSSLNTCIVQDRYPIQNIQVSSTQISQEVYISTFNPLRDFIKMCLHQEGEKF
ncbi:hypothetical protein O181_107412 [Austropuccinia psidii MF-1]|uniref:Uncharacterized protein n=1 Tax=Austropuccinia psidii MF-1 TaxID=1389203 RepID=A0A9Q3PPC3_9BASI|nr:hypothetical protein [Austropuccinia psidii MF-1]